MRGIKTDIQVTKDGQPLDLQIYEARGFWARFLGLMGTRELPVGHALLFQNCPSVHMCFMRYPLLVVFLDENFAVVGSEVLAPWKLSKHVPGAVHILECSADLRI